MDSHGQLLFPWHQRDARRWLIGALAALWNLDPAMLALLTLLHDRKIKRLSRREFAGDEGRHHELVVESIRELAATPGHFLDAFSEFRTVEKAVGLRVRPARRGNLPARLHHRL